MIRVNTPPPSRAVRGASLPPKGSRDNLTSLITKSELGHDLAQTPTTLHRSVWFQTSLVCVQCEFQKLCPLLLWMAFPQYYSSDCQSVSNQAHTLVTSNLDHDGWLQKAQQGPNIHSVVLWERILQSGRGQMAFPDPKTELNLFLYKIMTSRGKFNCLRPPCTFH